MRQAIAITIVLASTVFWTSPGLSEVTIYLKQHAGRIIAEQAWEQGSLICWKTQSSSPSCIDKRQVGRIENEAAGEQREEVPRESENQAPTLAKDQRLYEDGSIRVVAWKLDNWFRVCAWLVDNQSVRLVTVDLVFKDSFDASLAVSELLLVWDARARAFCNTWPLPAQARDFWKWELGSVILGLDCKEGKLIITHSTDTSAEIPASKLERIRQEIRRITRPPSFTDC